MITDPHDPRSFRRYVQFATDGTVASVHDVDARVEQPLPAAIEVTDLSPMDFTGLVIDPQIVATLQLAITDMTKKTDAVTVATAALTTSTEAVRASQLQARTAISIAVATPKP